MALSSPILLNRLRDLMISKIYLKILLMLILYQQQIRLGTGPAERYRTGRSKRLNQPVRSKRLNQPVRSKRLNQPVRSKRLNQPVRSKRLNRPVRSGLKKSDRFQLCSRSTSSQFLFYF
jgi:hypothetical protein